MEVTCGWKYHHHHHHHHDDNPCPKHASDREEKSSYREGMYDDEAGRMDEQNQMYLPPSLPTYTTGVLLPTISYQASNLLLLLLLFLVAVPAAASLCIISSSPGLPQVLYMMLLLLMPIYSIGS